jgi:hypothetical protein
MTQIIRLLFVDAFPLAAARRSSARRLASRSAGEFHGALGEQIHEDAAGVRHDIRFFFAAP